MRFLRIGLVFAAALSLPALAAEKAQRIEEVYPGLVPGALAYATLGELPEGVLLKSEAVQVTDKELQEELGKAPGLLREELGKNAPFVLEQMVAGKLLLEAAKKSLAERKVDVAKKLDLEIIQAHLDQVTEGVKVTPAELREFYDKNVALCGGTPFDKMKSELESFVLQQKKEAAVTAHVRTLGQRVAISVSAAWLAKQAPLARDNSVDKARFGGQPTLVDFGGAGCCGPDQMLPTVEAIEKKFKGKLAVLYVETKEVQVLAARYGVNSIPTQILFDKAGKEVFRHNGLMTQEEIVRELKAVGVK